jgi:hypothetical protein
MTRELVRARIEFSIGKTITRVDDGDAFRRERRLPRKPATKRFLGRKIPHHAAA